MSVMSSIIPKPLHPDRQATAAGSAYRAEALEELDDTLDRLRTRAEIRARELAIEDHERVIQEHHMQKAVQEVLREALAHVEKVNANAPGSTERR
jgi:hypothetical protein